MYQYPLQLIDSPELGPLAILCTLETSPTCNYLQYLVGEYMRHDDVISAAFFAAVVVVTDGESLDSDALQFLSSIGCQMVYLLPSACKITKEPFFFSSSGIFRASRLYPDTQEAFVLSTIASRHNPNM